MSTQNTQIIGIVAMNQHRIIGKPEGGMPWHIPEDLKYFKKQTMGSPMIVGRKTFEEFPKPLPGREHIVLTRDRHNAISEHPHVHFEHTPDSALARATSLATNGKVFVIGGASVYKAFLGIMDILLITKVLVFLPDGPRFPRFTDLFDKVFEEQQSDDNPLRYSFNAGSARDTKPDQSKTRPYHLVQDGFFF